MRILSLKSVLLFLLILAFLPTSHDAVLAQDSQRHVLILNSYHQGFGWSDNIIAGIFSILGGEDQNIEFHIEYMDTKRLFNEQHLENLYELYEHKFQDITFDVIIVSDNNAFDFVRAHRDELFPGTPVVFCGVNNYDDSMIEDHEGFTGVAEEVDIASSFDLMLQLHPEAQEIVVVNDKTTTGEANQEILEQLIPVYEDRIDFTVYRDFEIDGLLEDLAAVSDNTLIFLISLARDSAGQSFTYEESSELVSGTVDVPVYAVWDNYLGYGVVGGMLTSGFAQGEAAALKALRILEGEPVADIPVLKESPNRYMFDHRQLRHFNIPVSELPESSIILNEPPSFFARYRSIILGGGIIVIGLLVVIAVLASENVKRRRAEGALRKNQEDLEKIVDERTAELQKEIAIRKKAEAAQSFLLAAVVESSRDAIIALTPKGDVLSWNTGAAKMYGYQANEIKGSPVTRLFASEQPGEVRELLELVQQQDEAIDQYETTHRTKDGDQIDVLLTVSPIWDDAGEMTNFSLIVRDMTEYNLAQKERERLQQEVIEAQEQAIRELSSPIIPIMEGIIVMPVIGSIDTKRARDITRALLAGITNYQAKTVIVDITGVSMVDSGVADHLNKTIQAARLKGAQTIITGISDTVAETIVDLGIDWTDIETLRDLQSGLLVAMQAPDN